MNHQLQAEVAYMTRPELVFKEIPVLTQNGEAVMAGPHHWKHATIAFKDQPAALKELESVGYFDLTFKTPTETWELTNCLLETMNMRNGCEFTMSFLYAMQK